MGHRRSCLPALLAPLPSSKIHLSRGWRDGELGAPTVWISTTPERQILYEPRAHPFASDSWLDQKLLPRGKGLAPVPASNDYVFWLSVRCGRIVCFSASSYFRCAGAN